MISHKSDLKSTWNGRRKHGLMKAIRVALYTGAALISWASSYVFADQPPWSPLRTANLQGIYELVDRVLAGGKVLRRPDIAALHTFVGGRANVNLFVRNADGTLACESSTIRYTLSENNTASGSIIRFATIWTRPASLTRRRPLLRTAPRSRRQAAG
jgi:hypothetical protein